MGAGLADDGDDDDAEVNVEVLFACQKEVDKIGIVVSNWRVEFREAHRIARSLQEGIDELSARVAIIIVIISTLHVIRPPSSLPSPLLPSAPSRLLFLP